jgi:hypothetical protein
MRSWLAANVVVGWDNSKREDRGGYDAFDCPLTGACAPNASLTNRARAKVVSNVYTTQFSLIASHAVTDALSSRTSFGGRLVRKTAKFRQGNVSNLTIGVDNADSLIAAVSMTSDAADAVAGWFLEQSLGFRERIFLTGSFARDAGSAFGRNIQAPIYPRFGVSWVVSDEPFFRKSWLMSQFRLRAAYGHSGVQPTVTDGPATYFFANGIVDGQTTRGIQFRSTGNFALKPERTIEKEVGFEALMFGDRASLSFTAYDKRSRNALMPRNLAPSVPVLSPTRLENIGAVGNSGIEASIQATLLEYRGWRWTTTIGGATNRNKVITLGDGVLPFGEDATRIVEGYPVYGRWQRPVLAVRDVNGNGTVEGDEIVLGDTTVYVGSTQPRYTMQYTTNVTIPWGFSVSANLAYTGAVTQQLTTYNRRGDYDPTSSFEEQAYAQIARNIGDWQTVSVLRFNSIQVGYMLPPRLARAFRASSATVTFSGQNLGMWTQYRGADPSVNSTPFGDKLTDDGSALPLTRNWSLGMRLGF